MAACRVCNQQEVENHQRSPVPDVCLDCYRRGEALLVEPLRPRVPCARCGGTAIVRGVLRSVDSVGELAYSHLRPVKAAARTGIIESYICRRCGFTELYTRHAEGIPIGPEHGTELVDTAGDSPYR
jgi:hypothetical protein